ncbi:MAG: ATP-binding domain-containing protein, partial [Schlesneria sp.]
GDTIRITQNGQTQDTKHRLNNGALYEIESFTKKGDVKLSNGWVVGRDFGHWTHGYATTSHASQGKTVDQVFVAQSSTSLPASSLEQFYVSVSRARQNVTIYTDDKEALREAVQESSRRLSATELVSDVKPAVVPQRERTQEQLNQVRNYKRHLEYQTAEVTIPTRDYTNSIAAKFGRPTADREIIRE